MGDARNAIIMVFKHESYVEYIWLVEFTSGLGRRCRRCRIGCLRVHQSGDHWASWCDYVVRLAVLRVGLSADAASIQRKNVPTRTGRAHCAPAVFMAAGIAVGRLVYGSAGA